MISRLLGFDAVPAFVLFQDGKRYDDTLGKMSLGFASVVEKFDTLVDTLSDKSRLGEIRIIGDIDDWTHASGKADECKVLSFSNWRNNTTARGML